jgi:hypothetical protein
MPEFDERAKSDTGPYTFVFVRGFDKPFYFDRNNTPDEIISCINKYAF